MNPKKSQAANLEKHRGALFLIGLIVAASFALAAFEWRVVESSQYVKLEETFEDDDDMPYEIIVDIDEEDIEKEQKEQPEDKPQKTQFNEEEEPSDELDPDKIEETTKKEEETKKEFNGHKKHVVYVPPPKKDTVHIDWDPLLVQQQAEFIGGLEGMMKFLGDHIKYPSMARSANIQGTVHVQFVIDETGKVVNVKPLRGVEGGCTEEALRVVRLMPDWKPAEHFGTKVRMKFTLPVKFRLQ